MSGEFPTLAEVLATHQWSFIKHGCRCDDPATYGEWAGHVDQVWREACTIRTAEKLDALPDGTTVRDDMSDVMVRDGDAWRMAGYAGLHIAIVPALLIWHPEWTQS